MEVPSHIIHRKYFLNTNGLAQYHNVYVIKVIDITHVFFSYDEHRVSMTINDKRNY